MAQYNLATHTLEFDTDYENILVKNGSSTVATYSLTGSQAVRLTVSSGSYDLSYTSIPNSVNFAFEPLENPNWEFDGDRLGGGVVIDIRDIFRYENTELEGYNGTVDIEFELDGTTHDFWFEDGPLALKLKLGNENYHTITVS